MLLASLVARVKSLGQPGWIRCVGAMDNFNTKRKWQRAARRAPEQSVDLEAPMHEICALVVEAIFEVLEGWDDGVEQDDEPRITVRFIVVDGGGI